MPEPVRWVAAPEARVTDLLAFLEALTRGQPGLSTWADMVFVPETVDHLAGASAGDQRSANRIVPVAPIAPMMPGVPLSAGIDAHLYVRMMQRETVPASGDPMSPGYVPAVMEDHHWEVDLITAPSPSNAYPDSLIPPIFSAACQALGTPDIWATSTSTTAAVELNGTGWPAPWHMLPTVAWPNMFYGSPGEWSALEQDEP